MFDGVRRFYCDGSESASYLRTHASSTARVRRVNQGGAGASQPLSAWRRGKLRPIELSLTACKVLRMLALELFTGCRPNQRTTKPAYTARVMWHWLAGPMRANRRS